MDCKRFRLTVIGVLSVLLTASGQNYVNVALGKTYSQSSIHTSIQGPSSNAANGNTDGEYTATNCIHTVTNDPNDWWQVDLGGMYPLYNFMVWGRDQYASRLYPFAITVDSRACASVVNGSSLSVEVTCPSIMYGQVVRITRTNNTEMLNLCELQVLVCQAGYYGTTCDTPCHTIRCLNNQCDRVTGWCTQCPGNFQGDTCSDCVGGYYGPSCGRECLVNHTKCSDNQCDRTTGLCAACDGNYEGYDCSFCTAGYYGINCTTTCRSANCLNNRCEKTTGWCTACQGHYYGDTCSDYKEIAPSTPTPSPSLPPSDDQNSDAELPVGPIVGSIIGVGLILTVSLTVTVAVWPCPS